MPCYSPWVLKDGVGGEWALGVDVDGRITLVEGNPEHFPVLDSVLIADLVSDQVWQFMMLPSGQLQISAIPDPGIFLPSYIPAESPGGPTFHIAISGGMLQTIQQPPDPPVEQPIVGTIFDPEDYRPRFTQPGGPFTRTFPQQTVGELVALWTFGCGHSSNTIHVRRAAVNCQASSLLSCPICDYIQRTIIPADDIYSYTNEILFP